MTGSEIESLVQALRASGVQRFKSKDFEIEFIREAPQVEKPLPAVLKEESSSSKEPDKPIEHKVEELESILKLSDQDLVDRLFPDFTDDEELNAAEAS